MLSCDEHEKNSWGLRSYLQLSDCSNVLPPANVVVFGVAVVVEMEMVVVMVVVVVVVLAAVEVVDVVFVDGGVVELQTSRNRIK